MDEVLVDGNCAGSRVGIRGRLGGAAGKGFGSSGAGGVLVRRGGDDDFLDEPVPEPGPDVVAVEFAGERRAPGGEGFAEGGGVIGGGVEALGEVGEKKRLEGGFVAGETEGEIVAQFAGLVGPPPFPGAERGAKAKERIVDAGADDKVVGAAPFAVGDECQAAAAEFEGEVPDFPRAGFGKVRGAVRAGVEGNDELPVKEALKEFEIGHRGRRRRRRGRRLRLFQVRRFQVRSRLRRRSKRVARAFEAAGGGVRGGGATGDG